MAKINFINSGSVDIIRSVYYIRRLELMKFFAVLDVSLMMGLTRCYKTEGYFALITNTLGREFQISGAATGKARLPTVVDVTGGSRMQFVPAERSAQRPDTSVTRTSGRGNLVHVHVALCTP